MTFDEWWDSNRLEGLGPKSAAAFACSAAQEAEREACAKACEDLDLYQEDNPGESFAEAIRMRSNVEITGAGTASG